jgi:folate-binding protein YgfZ
MPSPIHPLHEQQGAEFQSYGDEQIVQTFGEPQAEYAAIRKAAAIVDFPQRGVLELTGRDRLPFLNNLLTNQTWDKQTKKNMPAGTAVYAFFLNTKGRVVADMNVVELGERTLLQLDARLVEPVKAAFDKFLFTEQVKMRNAAGDLHQFFLTGPKAWDAIGKLAAEPVQQMNVLDARTAKLAGHEVAIVRDDIAAVPGYWLVVGGGGVEAVWREFTKDEGGGMKEEGDAQWMRFKGLARPAGWAAFNATRIEGARPIFGIDFDDSILPAETGQFHRAVSVTKGCYLGQEIVARMHARQVVAKQLVGLRMDSDALPIAGVKIFDDNENEIGGITSSTVSPVLSGVAIALGYVKRPFFAPGTKLKVPAEGAMRIGTVVEGPFV